MSVEDELSRRPTWGNPPRDDWSIQFRGVGIGRIYKLQQGLPGPPWIWEIAILGHRGLRRGACASYDAARDAFRASWEQLRRVVHETELRAELEAHRKVEERYGPKTR